MPYYYNTNPNATPMSEGNGGRQISLSLKDLDASVVSEKVTFDENYPSNRSPEKLKEMEALCSDDSLRSSYQAVDLQEQQYQNNVNMLLHKSSGSKYEEMIKKFLASKGKNLNSDNKTEASSVTLAAARTSEKIGTTPMKGKNSTENISLLERSYKLAERSEARQSKSAILRRSQQAAAAAIQQEAITEVLSQPLERNKYVPPDRTGTPTNLRGRQRAPPRVTHSKSPINSTHKYNKSKASRSMVDASAVVEGSRSVSVSLDDFNLWIENNKSWCEKVEEKKQKYQTEEHERVGRTVRDPQLSSSSKMQAERSYMRKHSLSRGRSPGPSPRLTSPGPDTHSLEFSPDSRQYMQVGELDVTQSNDDVDGQCTTPREQGPRYEKDVFRRLYDEGKRYNEFNETMDMHRSRGRLVSNELSFSPRINQKSAAIMSKRSTSISNLFRSCSPSSYRMSDISREERQRHAIDSHRHRVRSMSPGNVKQRARDSVSLRGCTISKSYLSTKGGKMYPEAAISSILAEGKVTDVLSSSRSRSKQNSSAIIESRKHPPSYSAEVLSDGGKMYETRSSSKESKRINDRNEASFEDRMLKSMDEYRLKVKVNRDTSNEVTPGPGQYANTNESNRCCPLPKSSTADKQSVRGKIPGASAFTFGRTRRELL